MAAKSRPKKTRPAIVVACVVAPILVATLVALGFALFGSTILDPNAPSDANQRLVYASLKKSMTMKNPFNNETLSTEFEVTKWHKPRTLKGGANMHVARDLGVAWETSKIAPSDRRIAVQVDYKIKGRDDVWSRQISKLFLVEDGRLVDKIELCEVMFAGESSEGFNNRTGIEVVQP